MRYWFGICFLLFSCTKPIVQDINLIPNGTGDVVLAGDTVKVGDSGAAATLTSNGAGTLTVTTGGTTDLILNTNSGTNSGTIQITDGADGDIDFTCNGTGIINFNDRADYPQVAITSSSNATACPVHTSRGQPLRSSGQPLSKLT